MPTINNEEVQPPEGYVIFGHGPVIPSPLFERHRQLLQELSPLVVARVARDWRVGDILTVRTRPNDDSVIWFHSSRKAWRGYGGNIELTYKDFFAIREDSKILEIFCKHTPWEFWVERGLPLPKYYDLNKEYAGDLPREEF